MREGGGGRRPSQCSRRVVPGPSKRETCVGSHPVDQLAYAGAALPVLLVARSEELGGEPR